MVTQQETHASEHHCSLLWREEHACPSKSISVPLTPAWVPEEESNAQLKSETNGKPITSDYQIGRGAANEGAN